MFQVVIELCESSAGFESQTDRELAGWMVPRKLFQLNFDSFGLYPVEFLCERGSLASAAERVDGLLLLLHNRGELTNLSLQIGKVLSVNFRRVFQHLNLRPLFLLPL